MPENDIIMAQHRHCLETMLQCIEDQHIEDEELVTNALETIVNLGPLLDLRIFSSSKPSYVKIKGKNAVQAIMGMLDSPVRAWHCAGAEFLYCGCNVLFMIQEARNYPLLLIHLHNASLILCLLLCSVVVILSIMMQKRDTFFSIGMENTFGIS